MENASERTGSSTPTVTAIDFDALEQELARLWRPATAGPSAASDLPTRTSVLNLVIHATDEAMREHVHAVAEHLSSVHACRAIVFTCVEHLDRTSSTPEIYAACDRDHSRPHAPCIERIDIPIHETMVEHIHSLIEPLVIPELPKFVWWPGSPPFDRPGLKEMARASNRLVLDSLSFESTSHLMGFSELTNDLPACVPTDLNWERLQPWRELTAHYFDIKNVQWALDCVREVEIEAGQAPNGELPSQALLFACWLGHCLEWDVFEARRTRPDRWYIGAQDKRGEAIRVIIRTRPTTPEYSGHVLSLSISARNDEGSTSSLSLSRSRGSALIRMHAKSGFDTTLHHAVHHPLLPDEALLVHVLESTTPDHVFESSLEHAAGVVRRLERRNGQ